LNHAQKTLGFFAVGIILAASADALKVIPMAESRRRATPATLPTTGDLDRAARTILQAPSAKVFSFDTYWVCPMCTEVMESITSTTPRWADLALAHLKTACPAVLEGQRIPKIVPDQLRKNALPKGVRFTFASNPAWKYRDYHGAWYCPYCITSGIRVASLPPFTSREVDAIIAHILGCYAFDDGKGVPLPPAELRKAVDQSNGRLERVVRLILANPASRVFSFDTFWICPMCTRIVREVARSDAEWIELAARHLRVECGPVREGQIAPKMTPYQMQKKVLDEGLRCVIPLNPLWQHRDRSGRWYCPYCVEGDVQVPPEGPFTESDVDRIVRHVLHCFYFDSGRGTPKAVALLEETVRQADVRLDASQDLQTKLAEDPVWRVRDRNGCWLCPYCRRPVPAVDFSPVRPEDAVEDISQHLLKHCSGYRERVEPARDVSELAGVEETTRVVTRTLADERTELIQVDKKIYEMLVRIAKDNMVSRTESSHQMEQTLATAQKTQLKMLPKAPVVPGLEIEVLYRPSQQLSGDFYDFVWYDPRHLGLLIGDVSGHGIDAALVMGVIKKVLSLAGRMQQDPKDVLTYANEMIRPDLEPGTFITACYGVLDLSERVLRFASAGHNPILLFNPARGDMPVAMRPASLAMGIADSAQMEAALEQMEFSLQPGDVVLQYTDGLVEQSNPAGEMIEIEGLMEILRRESGEGIQNLLACIEEYLIQFRGEKPQEDDVTVLCFRVLEPSESDTPLP
jgi:serine phosphatase RsbU (regulator of sigma subunit)